MIYWVIIDERPEPIDRIGRIQYRVSHGKFEKLCQPEATMFQIEDDVFKIDNKKIIPLQEISLLVCDGTKLKKRNDDTR